MWGAGAFLRLSRLLQFAFFEGDGVDAIVFGAPTPLLACEAYFERKTYPILHTFLFLLYPIYPKNPSGTVIITIDIEHDLC